VRLAETTSAHESQLNALATLRTSESEARARLVREHEAERNMWRAATAEAERTHGVWRSD
jgi:hypothetical protein